MGRETRDRILQAATELFDERGFDGTSMAHLLDRAGVNSGSLYHFFDSKEALAAAVVERCGDRARELVDAVEESSPDPFERVLGLFELKRVARERGDPDRIDPIGLLAAELAERRPEVARLAAQSTDGVVSRVRGWLDAAGPRLPAGTDRDGLARFVVTVLEGASMRVRSERSLEPFDNAVNQLRALLGLLEDAAHRGASVTTPARAEIAEVPGPARDAGDPAGWRSW